MLNSSFVTGCIRENGNKDKFSSLLEERKGNYFASGDCLCRKVPTLCAMHAREHEHRLFGRLYAMLLPRKVAKSPAIIYVGRRAAASLGLVLKGGQYGCLNQVCPSSLVYLLKQD